jgi:hypothetical protein
MAKSSNGSPSSGGSFGRTSMPAPPSRPALRAAARAWPSSNPPRAVLISSASGFINANSLDPIMPRVESLSGQWSETMSAMASRSSRGTRSGTGLWPRRRPVRPNRPRRKCGRRVRGWGAPSSNLRDSSTLFKRTTSTSRGRAAVSESLEPNSRSSSTAALTADMSRSPFDTVS